MILVSEYLSDTAKIDQRCSALQVSESGDTMFHLFAAWYDVIKRKKYDWSLFISSSFWARQGFHSKPLLTLFLVSAVHMMSSPVVKTGGVSDVDVI